MGQKEMAGEGLVGPNKVFIVGYNWLTLFFTRWPISYFMSKSTLFSDTERKPAGNGDYLRL